ncbi:hypothetical protein HOY80DRAFT_954321 [Tuber brumale]|nr:hypothetical protein HOY80DRAFT_954321 [Tuber brumale]
MCGVCESSPSFPHFLRPSLLSTFLTLSPSSYSQCTPPFPRYVSPVTLRKSWEEVTLGNGTENSCMVETMRNKKQKKVVNGV